MTKKLTEMNNEELTKYVDKWTRKLTNFMQGSKNWQKVDRRIQSAKTQQRLLIKP